MDLNIKYLNLKKKFEIARSSKQVGEVTVMSMIKNTMSFKYTEFKE